MRKTLYIALTWVMTLVAIATTTSCSKEVQMTTIVVQDSIRHYYPLVQGTDMELSWRIANVGKEPLVLTDVQPSCGCITEDLGKNNIVLPGDEITLKFQFRTEGYAGYVRHTIRLFGNIFPKGMACLVFDTNVVAPAFGSPDYEERLKTRNERDVASGVKTLVDGNEGQRGYWTDLNEYSRGYNKYQWRDLKK